MIASFRVENKHIQIFSSSKIAKKKIMFKLYKKS